MVMEIEYHHRAMRSFNTNTRPKRARSSEALCERPTKRQLLISTEAQAFSLQGRETQLYPMSGFVPEDWVQQTDGLRLDSPMAVLGTQAVSSVLDEDTSMQDDENTPLRHDSSSSYPQLISSHPHQRTAVQPPTLAIPQQSYPNSQIHSASPRSYSPGFLHSGGAGATSSGSATPSSDMRMHSIATNPAIKFTPATPLDQAGNPQGQAQAQAQHSIVPVPLPKESYRPKTPPPNSASLEAQDSMMVSPASTRHGVPDPGSGSGAALGNPGFGSVSALESPVSTRATSRKQRFTMGPRADCEQCRMRVKGHWMHFD